MDLKCKVQNYEWGKKGGQSKVAVLQQSSNDDFTIDENTPYAELWMGTHVNAPSVVRSTGQLLGDLIAQSPEFLGKKVVEVFNHELPFLFKVLSVNKALSIQAHPTKEHAEQLHAKFPDVYKDPNHKPEMAVALTPFEALCGFRPVHEIRKFAEQIPALKKLLVDCNCEKNDEVFLRTSFRQVLTCGEAIRQVIDELLTWFKTLDCNQQKFLLAELVERLHSQFPYDCGILMVYFFNYLQLKPGEALYLGANEPHAYLSGDCVEIMACSDNVVRAGLTPKFIDVDTLCSMLNYKGAEAKEQLFKPTQEDCHTRFFKPPVQDFALAEIRLPKTANCYNIIPRPSASIIIVVEGKAKSNLSGLKPGVILFLPAGVLMNVSEVTDNLLMYQGLANIF